MEPDVEQQYQLHPQHPHAAGVVPPQPQPSLSAQQHAMAAAAMGLQAMPPGALPPQSQQHQSQQQQQRPPKRTRSGDDEGSEESSRKHRGDRRALRFWQPFNDWWREEFERVGRRPNSQEINKWYQENSYATWKDNAPTIQETRIHAKCLRSLNSVREYFRNYRAIKKGDKPPSHRGHSNSPLVTEDPNMAKTVRYHTHSRSASGVDDSTELHHPELQIEAPMSPDQQMKMHHHASSAGAAMPGVDYYGQHQVAAGLPHLLNQPGWGQAGMEMQPNELVRTLAVAQLQQAAAIQQQLVLAALAQQYTMPPQQMQARHNMRESEDGEEVHGAPDEEQDPSAAQMMQHGADPDQLAAVAAAAAAAAAAAGAPSEAQPDEAALSAAAMAAATAAHAQVKKDLPSQQQQQQQQHMAAAAAATAAAPVQPAALQIEGEHAMQPGDMEAPRGNGLNQTPLLPGEEFMHLDRQEQLDYMNKLQAELLAHRQAIMQMYSLNPLAMPHPE